MAKKKEPVFQARLDAETAQKVEAVRSTFPIKPTLQRVVNSLLMLGADEWLKRESSTTKER